MTITGTSSEELFQKVTRYFKGINVNYDEQSIRNSIRRQNDFNFKPFHRIKLSDSIKGAKALIRYTTGKAVPNNEILRRANICRQCKMLSEVSDCMSCGGSGRVTNLINTIRSAKGTEVKIPEFIRKKFCGVCSCSIPLLIVTKHSDLEPDNKSRPNICWMNPTSTNFKSDE